MQRPAQGRPLAARTGLVIYPLLAGLNRRRVAAGLALLLAVAISVVSGCSANDSRQSDAGSPGLVQKVTASDRVYTTDDLRAGGLKVNRQYDVSGLEGATSAINGFKDRVEYEARFYRSHVDAVSLGGPAAALVTGERAIVLGSGLPWEEGATDRRKCVGSINANCIAKYGDYVIVGNLVLLCEGLDSATALQACRSLMSALPPP